jgi:hypothetical protein
MPSASQPTPHAQQPQQPHVAVLDGVLERVTFSNPETGYTIARIAPDRGTGGVSADTELIAAVGPLLGARVGESLRLRGRWSPDRICRATQLATGSAPAAGASPRRLHCAAAVPRLPGPRPAPWLPVWLPSRIRSAYSLVRGRCFRDPLPEGQRVTANREISLRPAETSLRYAGSPSAETQRRGRLACRHRT